MEAELHDFCYEILKFRGACLVGCWWDEIRVGGKKGLQSRGYHALVAVQLRNTDI